MTIETQQHAFRHSLDDKEQIADMGAHGTDVAWLLTLGITTEDDVSCCHRTLHPCQLRDDGPHAVLPLSDQIVLALNVSTVLLL